MTLQQLSSACMQVLDAILRSCSTSQRMKTRLGHFLFWLFGFSCLRLGWSWSEPKLVKIHPSVEGSICMDSCPADANRADSHHLPHSREQSCLMNTINTERVARALATLPSVKAVRSGPVRMSFIILNRLPTTGPTEQTQLCVCLCVCDVMNMCDEHVKACNYQPEFFSAPGAG